MSSDSPLKKPLLYALVVSVLLTAMLGILLVLRNTWGWFEVRVILTTVIVAVASVCGLACDLSRTPRGSNWLPSLGLLLTGVSAAMLLFGVWTDPFSELYWKTTTCLTIYAVATVHICLLSIAKLVGRFAWVFFAAQQLIYGLATLITVIILGELSSDAMWRFAAALAIVVGAMTLVIPILHRIGKIGVSNPQLATPIEQRNLQSIDEEIAQLNRRLATLQQIRRSLDP